MSKMSSGWAILGKWHQGMQENSVIEEDRIRERGRKIKEVLREVRDIGFLSCYPKDTCRMEFSARNNFPLKFKGRIFHLKTVERKRFYFFGKMVQRTEKETLVRVRLVDPPQRGGFTLKISKKINPVTKGTIVNMFRKKGFETI